MPGFGESTAGSTGVGPTVHSTSGEAVTPICLPSSVMTRIGPSFSTDAGVWNANSSGSPSATVSVSFSDPSAPSSKRRVTLRPKSADISQRADDAPSLSVSDCRTADASTLWSEPFSESVLCPREFRRYRRHLPPSCALFQRSIPNASTRAYSSMPRSTTHLFAPAS